MIDPALVVRAMNDLDRGIWATSSVGSVPDLVEQSVYLRASARRLGLLDEHGCVSQTGFAVQQYLRRPPTSLRRRIVIGLAAYFALCVLFGIAYFVQGHPWLPDVRSVYEEQASQR